jgi:hypothetical protein
VENLQYDYATLPPEQREPQIKNTTLEVHDAEVSFNLTFEFKPPTKEE